MSNVLFDNGAYVFEYENVVYIHKIGKNVKVFMYAGYELNLQGKDCTDFLKGYDDYMILKYKVEVSEEEETGLAAL